MTELLERVVALLQDPLDVALADSIFGTADPAAIVRRVERFCVDRLGSEPTACLELSQSVGAVFALELARGGRVALKFHALGAPRLRTTGSLGALTAVYSVQGELARLGLPCAAVVHPPIEVDGVAVAAMTYLDGSGADDPGDPRVRRAMADGLAEVVRLARPFGGTPMLPVMRLPEGLWPTPHNVLFDLQAPGGGWIDDRARAARAVLDAGGERPIVFHTDFSAANVRVRDGRIRAIYDMDSVALVDEMRGLAGAAVHFTYTGTAGEPRTSREQARAFVADYERARGVPLGAAERQRLDAAALYAMAYTARCEHSLDLSGARLEGSMRAALRAAPPTGYLGHG